MIKFSVVKMGMHFARLGALHVGDKERVAIMGVLNLDPHSFYSGSSFASANEAFTIAVKMIEEQVDIIDIGGASSAPGAPTVSVAIEKKRVRKLIRRLTTDFDVPLSIDTQRASVAKDALACGATIVNDVSGLKSDADMAQIIQDAGASCILMAANQRPGDCHSIPQILSALRESLQLATTANIPLHHIVIDPGIGFGKPVECDLQIIRNLGIFRELDRPILLGISRKNFIGKVLGYSLPEDRLYGSLAATTVAVLKKIHVIRTHDVSPTNDCVRMVQALEFTNGCD
ncbi:MAG: dihydropteroate synthase [Candidatus Hermodarchaeota archaeon]|jgi:dihydropteroate synthase|nr:dihydropteroate synthase [Candidatus Hermodarchaeota archaeon]